MEAICILKNPWIENAQLKNLLRFHNVVVMDAPCMHEASPAFNIEI